MPNKRFNTELEQVPLIIAHRWNHLTEPERQNSTYPGLLCGALLHLWYQLLGPVSP